MEGLEMEGLEMEGGIGIGGCEETINCISLT